MDVVPALIVCFLMVSMTAVQSQIRKGPANALKKVGESVTLECVTVNNNCHQVDWQKVEGLQSPKLVYRNGQGMLNTDSYPTTRYSVNNRGGCSLTITKLEIGDSGRFICVLAVDSGEETKSSILVVISVTDSCLSNVKSYVLDKGDGYSLRCAINIPAKSVEPSNVTLSFHNKTACETDTTDENQQLTVRTTLTGIATNVNIMRVCRASFPPNRQANYVNTTAFLDICATQPLIVSYPVENIAVSLVPGKDDTVRCTADGHPPPTFKWTDLKSGKVVDGDTLKIKGDAGDNYTCTATNMFKGRAVSRSVLYEVVVTPPPCLFSAPGCGSGGVAGAVIGIIIIVGGVVVGGFIFSWKDERSPLFVWLHSNEKNGADPVENVFISVSLPGPDKDITVRCTADGHPPPTFKWTIGKSGDVVDGDTLEIKGDAGDKYTCTATNTVKGRVASQNITIEFTSPPPEDYPVANIFISVSPPGTDNDFSVRCTADGHPPPTFKWTNSKGEVVADGDTLLLNGDVGDKYTCTATNTVNGKETSQNITVEFTSPPEEALGPGGIVTGTIIGSGVIRGVSFVVWRRSEKTDDEDGEQPPRSNDAPEEV